MKNFQVQKHTFLLVSEPFTSCLDFMEKFDQRIHHDNNKFSHLIPLTHAYSAKLKSSEHAKMSTNILVKVFLKNLW